MAIKWTGLGYGSLPQIQGMEEQVNLRLNGPPKSLTQDVKSNYLFLSADLPGQEIFEHSKPVEDRIKLENILNAFKDY